MAKLQAFIVVILLAAMLQFETITAECWFNYTRIDEGNTLGLQDPCVGLLCKDGGLTLSDCPNPRPEGDCLHRKKEKYPICCRYDRVC
ncbi:uncharacterized protein LOC142590376 isoform X2 [Dermacentor variabilis]|uniref:uncharacterized protein LOC142590376 isoform X2 n=1 Tax=Dermacentor variabilis TaxID=34621 RepID=UPI003F5B644E